MKNKLILKRNKKKLKVRSKIAKNTKLLRISVFRSSKRIYAQVIDDRAGVTVANSSDYVLQGNKKVTKTEKAKSVGIDLGKKLIDLKRLEAVFDRGHYKYEGRVKALCEGLREAGIKI